VFATWPGHFPNGHPPGHVQYSWFATVPTTTCSPAGTSNAQDAAEIGQKAVRFRQPLSAFGCFLVAAQKGDGQSKAIVGLMYRDGIGTAVNYDEALRWLKAGAIQGDYNAQLGLAQVYEVGIGTAPDPALAQMWKQRADTNPVIVAQRQQQQQQALQQSQQAQQQQAAQQMMFLGLAAVVEAMSRPDVYVVY
jgi:TPR repeat protein